MQQILQNSFQDGLALDVTDLYRSNTVIKDSVGFDLTGAGDYFALTLNKGAELLSTFPALSAANLIGSSASAFSGTWQWSNGGSGSLWTQSSPYAINTVGVGSTSAPLYRAVKIFAGQNYTFTFGASIFGAPPSWSGTFKVVILDTESLNVLTDVATQVVTSDSVRVFQFTATHTGYIGIRVTNSGSAITTFRVNAPTLTRDGATSTLPRSVKSFPVLLKIKTDSRTITYEQGAVLFVIQNDYLCIYYQRSSNGALYRIYKELIEYNDLLNYYIDGVVYPELGEDTLYFTDGVKELRKLNCFLDLTVAYTDALSATNLSLLKRAPAGLLTFSSVTTKGSLKPGAYQYVIRLINEETLVSTKFSVPTAPVYVFATKSTSDAVTNKSVVLQFVTPTTSLQTFTKYQIGVIEYLDSSGATPEVVKLLPTKPLKVTNFTIVHTANDYADSISLAEAVVPSSGIFTAGTINQAQNRLIGADVTYANLRTNGVTPQITQGSFIQQPLSSGGYADETNATLYRSAFRNELYRYYALYYDEYGNFGPPQYLDASQITGNSATTTLDNNLYKNAFFDLGATDWTQLDPYSGGAWTFGAFANTPTLNTNDTTKVLSQAVPYIRNKRYGVKLEGAYTVGVGYASGQISLVYMNSTTVVGTSTIFSYSAGYGVSTTINLPGTVISVPPVNVPYTTIGIRVTNTGTSTAQFSLSSLELGDPVKDVLYPRRGVSFGVDYSLLNGSSQPKALGIQATVTGHPTWAKGMIIGRAKRKPKVLSQTPVVPMVQVSGIGAAGPYPSKAYINSPVETKTYDDAQPQPRIGTLLPASLGLPSTSDQVVVQPATTDTHTQYATKGGPVGATAVNVFIDHYIYEDKFDTGAYANSSLRVVDAVLLKAKTDSSPFTLQDPAVVGAYSGPNLPYISQYGAVATTFYAVGNQYYYFGSTGRSSDSSQLIPINLGNFNPQIVEAASMPQFSAGTVVSGFPVLQYKNFVTENAPYGVEPFVYKSNVFLMEGDFPTFNFNYNALTFGGSQTWTPNATHWLSIAGVNYYQNSSLTDLAPTLLAASDFSESRPVKVLAIANVENDLNDQRYGGVYDQHDIESTGAHYVFNEAELYQLQNNAGHNVSVLLNIYGGDCFITPHTFKVSNRKVTPTIFGGTVGALGGTAAQSVISRYGRAYYVGSYARPATFSGNISESITTYLESTYNGTQVKYNTYKTNYTPSGSQAPVPYEEAEASDSVPSYRYNINYSQTAGARVFNVFDQSTITTDRFPCRLFWTDLKLYNTIQKGFDTIKAGSVYDVPELHRQITKIAVTKNNLYAVAVDGIIYLPIGNKVIEQGNANTLQVRSEEIIGQHIVIDYNKGATTADATSDGGDVLYVFDRKRQDIYVVSGTEAASVGVNVNSFIRALSADSTSICRLHNDTKTKQLVVYDSNSYKNIRFNYEIKKWLGSIGFSNSVEQPQLYYQLDNELCVLRADTVGPTTTLRSLKLYSANAEIGNFDANTPYVTFVVTEPQLVSKVFDNFVIDESQGLASVKIVSYTNTVNEITHTFALTSDVSQELDGKLRVLIPPKDDNKLRGKRAEVTLYFTKDIQAVLASVLTKFTLTSPRL